MRHGQCNAQLGPREIERVCALDVESRQLLERAMQTLQLSARATHRILKVARTIADLADSASLARDHLAEAIQYRCLDRPL